MALSVDRASFLRLSFLRVPGLAAVAFAAALGCDGTYQGAAIDGGAPQLPDVMHFVTSMTRATCAKVDQCCPTADRARVLGVGTNAAECEATLGSFYGRQYGGLEAVLTGDRTRFDRALLDECLEAYRTAGCSAPGLMTANLCRGVFAGALATGTACENGFECQTRYCAGPMEARECRARKRDGEMCTRGNECESGVCETSLFSGVCTSEPTNFGSSCGGDGFWMVF